MPTVRPPTMAPLLEPQPPTMAAMNPASPSIPPEA